MPDDHSDVVPLLPIPNRTVKRVSADDSADPRVKVGHCQAITAAESPTRRSRAFCLFGSDTGIKRHQGFDKNKNYRLTCNRQN